MDDVLYAREKRVEIITELMMNKKVVLSVRANYPGSNKDNETTRKLVNTFSKEIENTLPALKKLTLNNGEGLVSLYLIDSIDSLEIKELTTVIEDTHVLGRFIDIDVYYNSIKSISRKDVMKSRRKCFLCDNDAFICIREQRHDIRDLTRFIDEAVNKYE